MLLKDICQITMGQSPKSESYNDKNVGIPFYQGNADFGELYPTTRLWCSEPKKIANRGDLLISVRAPIGAINYAKETCCIGRGLAKLKINPNIADNKFLYYFLLSQKSYFNSQGNGSTFKAISKNILEDTKIPFYNLAQQKYIGNILNKIYIIQSQYKQILSLCDIINKALFVEMFGDPMLNSKKWLKLPFHEVIKYANNGMSRRGNDKNGSIVLRLTELQKGYIDYANPNKILLTDNEKEKYILFNNDLLFARVNGNPMNVGRCAEFSIIDEPVYYNDHIIRVRVDTKKLNSCFANILFNSKYGKKELSNKIKTSAGQYTISQDGIGSVQIILPPIKLQEKFAESIKQIDKHKLLIID